MGRTRADASHNRDALLRAAFQLFSEKGIDVPLAAVARRAGVAPATLYRHFGTRESLFEAVVNARFAAYARTVQAAVDAPDPWIGLRSMLMQVLALQAEDHALANLCAAVEGRATDLEQVHRQAREGTAELVARAKAAGQLRPDFELQDVGLILMACAGVMERTAERAPGSWERLASFLIDGLHSSAASSAPPPPQADAFVAAVSGRVGGSVASLG